MSKSYDIDSFLKDLDSGKLSTKPSTKSNSHSVVDVNKTNFCKPSSNASTHPKTSTSTASSSNVDEFLAKLGSSSSSSSSFVSYSSSVSSTSKHPISNSTTSESRNKEQNSKCLKVFLGDESITRGLYRVSSGVSACDSLHCTKCDLKVVTLHNLAWKKNAQYIDFRNANTKFSSLLPLTIPRPGTTAYCCQCTWRSVSHLAGVNEPLQKYQDREGGWGNSNDGSATVHIHSNDSSSSLSAEAPHWVCTGH